MSAQSERTTLSSQSPSGCVTITHPHHPLRGQQLPVVCVRHGERPDVIVRLPDGSHAAVALSATDYAADPLAALAPGAAPHLLDLQGLRQLAQLIDEFRRQGRLTHRTR
jgi:Family of unknown function (DUF5372)